MNERLKRVMPYDPLSEVIDVPLEVSHETMRAVRMYLSIPRILRSADCGKLRADPFHGHRVQSNFFRR
jgi:hypothetical protein